MLIPLSELIQKFNIKSQITGIFHVGASHAEELQSYISNGIENMIWIEAIPEIYEKMQLIIKPYPKALGFNACISDVSDKDVEFKITNNSGQSSSFLNLKIHKEVHPDVFVTKTIKLKTKTISEIIEQNNINIANYNFLNMDIQGCELFALKGIKKEYFDNIKYIYLEVSTKELYENCALLPDIDEFLNVYGFKRAMIRMTDCFWGDAFYIKN